MFEAYRIGVRLSLINNISSGLNVISGHFARTHGEAVRLQKQVEKIALGGLAGAAIGGAGFMGLKLIGQMIKPSEEYAHQLNILNMAGLKQAEVAQVVADSWKNSGNVLTTTVTSNMRDLLDLKNIMGDLGEARTALPIFTKIQTVMAASQEGKVSRQAEGFAYSMAKAMDIVGAVRDPREFEKESEMMSKVIIATQGRVTPEAFKSVFQYARQAKIPLGNEFKYEIAPTLIQENASIGSGGGGGGSRGVGPMLAAFYRWSNQGFVNKKSIPELESLGLMVKNSGLKTTTSSTTIDPLKDAKLAAFNPFKWTNEVAVPAIYKKYGKISDEEVVKHLNEIARGNQLAASVMTEYFYKQKNFLRDQRIIRGTMSTEEAFEASMSNDPVTARKALASQWDKTKLAGTMSLVPILIPSLIGLAKGLDFVANGMRNNQGVVKTLGITFGFLSGAMAIGGTILTTVAGFKLLRLGLTVLNAAQGAGSMVKFVSILGKGGLVGAAIAATAAIGYLVGTGLNALINWATKKLTGKDTFGEAFYDYTHGKEALPAGWAYNARGIAEWVGFKKSPHGVAAEDFNKDYHGVDFGSAAAKGTKPLIEINPNKIYIENTGKKYWDFDKQYVERTAHKYWEPRKEPYVEFDPVKPSAKKQPIQVSTKIHLDGKQIATVVSQHQANEADRAQFGLTNGFDPLMTPTPIGY